MSIDIRAMRPCYTKSLLDELLARYSEWTPRLVLEQQDVPAKDRLWVVLRRGALPDRVLRLFAAECAEHALLREREAGREPDARSFAAVSAARQFARGEINVAALRSARVYAAAYAAAYAADAADAAAYAADAADAAAERDAQVVDLLRIMDEEGL